MNDTKVLGYEIRRIMISKKYFYILLVLGIWTYDVLTRLVIEGMGGTAPFSQYNYASFSAILNPMLLSIVVLLGLSVFSEKEDTVRKIIFSTPISQARYYMIKGLTIFIVSLVTVLLPIFMSYVYFGYYFHYYNYFNFIFPAAIFILPAMIFVLGLLMVLGKWKPRALYVLLPIVFFGGLINFGFSSYFDLSGNNFFINYIAQEIAGDRGFEFILPGEFLYSRVLFSISGMTLFIIACKIKVRRIA